MCKKMISISTLFTMQKVSKIGLRQMAKKGSELLHRATT